MKEFLNLIVVCVAACGIYYAGFFNGAKNVWINKTADSVAQISVGVETLRGFPERFGKKVDAVMEDVKSWFRWKRGPNGEIMLDPSSPIFDDVDRQLRESESQGTVLPASP